MLDFVDVALTENNDISFDENGDFNLTNGFNTSLDVSLFADARADNDEMSVPQLRRGWWGNLFLDVEIGSKLWFLDQATNIQERLTQAINYARIALQWLVDRQLADNIQVEGTQDESSIFLNITVQKDGNIITERNYQLWRNTITNAGASTT